MFTIKLTLARAARRFLRITDRANHLHTRLPSHSPTDSHYTRRLSQPVHPPMQLHTHSSFHHTFEPRTIHSPTDPIHISTHPCIFSFSTPPSCQPLRFLSCQPTLPPTHPLNAPTHTPTHTPINSCTHPANLLEYSIVLQAPKFGNWSITSSHFLILDFLLATTCACYISFESTGPLFDNVQCQDCIECLNLPEENTLRLLQYYP